jgi:cell wall hydrolase
MASLLVAVAAVVVTAVDGRSSPEAKAAGGKIERPLHKSHMIRSGETLLRIARREHTTVQSIEQANPGLDPMNLPVGIRLRLTS